MNDEATEPRMSYLEQQAGQKAKALSQALHPSSFCAHPSHCITCSDEAIEARIVDIDQNMLLATISVDGATAEVDISLVDELAIGDRVLIHGGVAIAKL